MTSSSDDNIYTNENICCMQDFLSEKSCLLPAVVRVIPSDYEIPDNDEEIPRGIEMLLSKLPNLKIARVKVLQFDDEEQVIASKGTEFVRRRSELVDREFFLPAEYQGSVKCIPRPRSRKLFTTIKEVLEDLPRYIKFNTESPSCKTSGQLNEGQNVASGSVLVLSKIYTFTDSAFRFLTCSIGNKNFLFREDQKVNLEAINDGQLHNFSELSRLPVLPLFIQLGYVNPTHIVCEDDDAAESLLTALSGPLEVTQFVKSNMLMAWTSNGVNEPCTKVLMLRKSARDRNVQLHASFSDDEAKAYIEKHFRDFNKTEWLRKSIYALNADKTNTERFIWLKRPLPSDQKQVASVKPRVATKQAGVAAKQEKSPPVSPGKRILPESPEESTPSTGNIGQDYLNCVPEKENESGQQIMVLTDTYQNTPKSHGGPKRQTSSSSETNIFDSSTNTLLMNSLKAIGQPQETQTPIPSTHLKTTDNENQDQNRLLKTVPQGSLTPCSPSSSFTVTESNTDTNAGDAVRKSVVQPLISPRNKLTNEGNDSYCNVEENDSSSNLHFTTCTNKQTRNKSNELSQTSFTHRAQCSQNETVQSDIVDQTDDPQHIPPKPFVSFQNVYQNVASNKIIDTSTLKVNKYISKPNLPPKPSAKPKTIRQDKNNDSLSSGICLEDPEEITCVTTIFPMSLRIHSDASLADTSRSSPLSQQWYPEKIDETIVLYPENLQRSVQADSMAITKSQSASSLYKNMESPQTIFTLKTSAIKVKPKILPKPRNDGYEEMSKCDNETFVLNANSGLTPSGSNSKNNLSVQPQPFAQDDNVNAIPNSTVRKTTPSYTNVSVPKIRQSLDNSELEYFDDKDDYEDQMDPLNTLSDNEVNQEGTSEFTTGNVDATNVMRTGQTKEHFYDYSVLDVHVCFKMCFPENIEISNLTLEYRLDGGFFRDDGLESFCETAKVGGLQKKKLMKIINDGWRPKL